MYNTFGPCLVLVPRTLQPVASTYGVATDMDTGEVVETYTLDEIPARVATNMRGYVGTFKAPDTSVRLMLNFAGTQLPVIANEIFVQAATELAQRVTNIKVIDGRFYIVDGANDAKIIASDGKYFVEEIV